MRKHEAKTINQTFSLPVEVSSELHTCVKPRERSRFVADAIRKELKAKKDELRNAYLAANEDEGQLEATEEWKSTLADGTDEW
jgi:metal-responsive CopG/Arc/MetJ family transcriptional regulator